MESPRLLAKSEEEIFTAIGYLVVRWNYAEFFARQILRAYVQGDSLFHPEHLKLSRQQSWWIEDELRKKVLPLWTRTGRPYLERLVEAYATAREHRNHLFHGIYDTFAGMGEREAQALLYPAKPKNGRPQAPSFVPKSEVRRIADHFHDLAMFSRDVSIAFDAKGDRALDSDGNHVIAELPALVEALPACTYETIDPKYFIATDGDA